MSPLWRGVSILAVILLFILAVLSSTQSLTVGLPQSILLLAVALIALGVFRRDRDQLIKWSLIVFSAGVIVRLVNAPTAQILSDSLIALAIVVTAVYLLGPPLARLPRRLRILIPEISQRLGMPASADFIAETPKPRTALGSAWLPFAIGAVLIVGLSAATSGTVGAKSASLQWITHLLTTHVTRDGARLHDSAIAIGGSAASVAFPDSLLLLVLKLIAPAAWPSFFGNLIVAFSIALFVFACVMFLGALGLERSSAVVAIILFLLLPVGVQIRFAAPFDLSIALIASLVALSPNARNPAILVTAFATGLVNTANGYEFAALILTLLFCNLMPRVRPAAVYICAAFAGVAGSIVASVLILSASSSISLREAWWFAQEIPRIVWAEAISVSWLAIIVFALLAGAGISAMLRQRTPLLRFALVLAIISVVLALPTRLGGIPLVSPADLLQVIAPQGWPSARFAQLLAFALTIPVGYAVSTLIPGRIRLRGSYTTAINCIAATVLVFLCLPQTITSVLPSSAKGAGVVEFPISESYSRAGIAAAEDLLAGKARIVQPIPFLDERSSLALESAPTDPAAIRTMQNANIRLIVLREDIYARPDWRTVQPRLDDPAFSAIPNVDAPYPWKVITYIPPAQRS